jgi:putative Mg2+ transporter-C (MgtC) family protein
MSASVSDLEAITRFAVAGGLGFGIGLERQLRGNTAGSRTFALLSMGAAAFTVVAVGFGNDGRVIAGIVTGVGFIGAGMIFHDAQRRVVGFATASSSWAIVAVGVLAGAGRLVVALVLAAFILVVLEVQYLSVLQWVASRYDLHQLEQASDPEPARPPPS